MKVLLVNIPGKNVRITQKQDLTSDGKYVFFQSAGQCIGSYIIPLDGVAPLGADPPHANSSTDTDTQT